MTLSPVLCLELEIFTLAKIRAHVRFSHDYISLLQFAFTQANKLIDPNLDHMQKA